MECTRGVYCVDIEINAKARSRNLRDLTISKSFTKVPLALDDELNPVNKDFLKRFLDQKVINMYNVNYSITNKKYLSGLCYEI
jgi:hypothetical protein